MGFFDFLKKEQKETISFEDLHHWLDDFMMRKDLEKRTEVFNSRVKDLAEQIRKKAEELLDAELMNPNISDKEMHYMTGNRKNFVNEIKRFSKSIQPPEDYRDVGYFASELSETMAELVKSTNKNVMVLKHFLEKEVREITGLIKELEDYVIEFRRELEDENLGLVQEIRNDLKNLSDSVQRKAELEEKIKEKQDSMKQLEVKESKIQNNIEEIKESPEYAKFQGLHEEKASVEEDIENMKKELEIQFGKLERPLKKYAYNTPDEKVVMDFLDNPHQALLRDDDLKISKVIDEMKNKLHELGLKERQKLNATDACEKLSSEFLKEARETIVKGREEISNLTQRMKGNVTFLNLTEQEGFLQGTKNRKEKVEQEMKELKNEHERINISAERGNIKEKVKQLGNVEFA